MTADKQKSILIAEGTFSDGISFDDIFKDIYKVTRLSEIGNVLDYLRIGSTAAVIIDISDAQARGLRLLEAICADPAARRIPVIVAASGDDPNLVKALELGAADVLSSFTPEIVRRRIANTAAMSEKLCLSELEAEYRKAEALYGSLPCGVIQYGSPEEIATSLCCNEAAWKLLGYECEDEFRSAVCDGSISGCIGEDKQQKLLEIIRWVQKTGLQAEMRICFRSCGKQRWLNTNIRRIDLQHSGSLLQMTYMDITELIETRQAYNTQQDEMSAIISSIPGGIFKYSADEDEQFVYVSDTMLSMLGYTREEFKVKFHNRFSYMIYQEDRAKALAKIDYDISQTGCTDSCEYRIETKSGELKWVYDAGNLITDADGRKWFIVVIVDIDERKTLEKALLRDRHEMTNVINSIPGGIASFELHSDGPRLIYASAGVPSLSGRTMEQYRALYNVTKETDIYPPDKARVLGEIEKSVSSGTETDITYRIAGISGQPVWIDLHGCGIGEHNGYPVFHAVFHNLSASTELYRKIIDETENILLVADLGTHEVLFANKAAERLAGDPLENSYGRSCYDYMKWRGTELESSIVSRLAEMPLSQELAFKNRHYLVRISEIDWNGHGAYLINMADHTDNYNTQARINSILSNIPGGLAEFRIENGSLIRSYISDGAKQILGYDEGDEPSENIDDVYGRVYPDDRERFRKSCGEAIGKRKPLNLDLRVKPKNGAMRWINITANPVEGSDGVLYFYGVYTDVTKRRRIEEAERLRHEKQREAMTLMKSELEVSRLDNMTGIYNRAATEELIGERLKDSRNGCCVLLVLDLDNLKLINDNFGHIQGDRALHAIGAALKKHFRGKDIIGRIGGDEFMVLLTDVQGEAAIYPNLRTLLREISGIYIGDRDEYAIHCSIGCAAGEAGSDTFDTLYSQADTALYQVKQNGKNDVMFYHRSMKRRSCFDTSGYTQGMRSGARLNVHEMQRLINAVATYYPLVLSANLSRNYYNVMYAGTPLTSQIPQEGEIEKLFAFFRYKLYEDDADEICSSLSRDALLREYESGKLSVRRCFRLSLGSDYGRWTELISLFYENEDGDVCEIALGRSISDKDSDI